MTWSPASGRPTPTTWCATSSTSRRGVDGRDQYDVRVYVRADTTDDALPGVSRRGSHGRILRILRCSLVPATGNWAGLVANPCLRRRAGRAGAAVLGGDDAVPPPDATFAPGVSSRAGRFGSGSDCAAATPLAGRGDRGQRTRCAADLPVLFSEMSRLSGSAGLAAASYLAHRFGAGRGMDTADRSAADRLVSQNARRGSVCDGADLGRVGRPSGRRGAHARRSGVDASVAPANPRVVGRLPYWSGGGNRLHRGRHADPDRPPARDRANRAPPDRGFATRPSRDQRCRDAHHGRRGRWHGRRRTVVRPSRGPDRPTAAILAWCGASGPCGGGDNLCRHRARRYLPAIAGPATGAATPAGSVRAGGVAHHPAFDAVARS